MKKLGYLILVLGTVSKFYAQDPQYTQFNSVPQYLNPAFAGNGDREHRATAAYRNQWPGIKKSFTSYMVSYDKNLINYNAGVGVFVMQDKAGASNLTNTQVGLNLAYALTLNPDIKLRVGLQACANQKTYHMDNLVFNDQFITGAAASQDGTLVAEPTQYASVGTGILLDSKFWWVGFSARHLNQPNTSLRNTSDKLPTFMSIHGGYNHQITRATSPELKAEQTIGPVIHYRHQGKADQLDLGLHYFYKFLDLTMWYRGIPFKTYAVGYKNSESVAFQAAYAPMDKTYRIGYSYDVTISSLGIKNSGGCHEITLGYEFGKSKNATRKARTSIGNNVKF